MPPKSRKPEPARGAHSGEHAAAAPAPHAAESALPPPDFPDLSYAGLAALGRDSIEAVVQSNAAISAGIEAMGREIMVAARAALQAAGATARALLEAKTFEEVVRLQTDLAWRNFDELVQGSTRLQELSCSVASRAIEPWQNAAARA